MNVRYLSALVVALAAGCSDNPLLSTSEGRAVDSYLQRRLDNAAYEVVEWSPAAESTAIRDLMLTDYRRILATCRERADDLQKQLAAENARPAAGIAALDDAERLQRLDRMKQIADELEEQTSELIPSAQGLIGGIESGTVNFCRLRYRVKNQTDSAAVKDQVFSVTGGLATPVNLPRRSAPDETDAAKRIED